jgi:hypothetical protein
LSSSGIFAKLALVSANAFAISLYSPEFSFFSVNFEVSSVNFEVSSVNFEVSSVNCSIVDIFIIIQFSLKKDLIWDVIFSSIFSCSRNVFIHLLGISSFIYLLILSSQKSLSLSKIL